MAPIKEYAMKSSGTSVRPAREQGTEQAEELAGSISQTEDLVAHTIRIPCDEPRIALVLRWEWLQTVSTPQPRISVTVEWWVWSRMRRRLSVAIRCRFWCSGSQWDICSLDLDSGDARS